MLKSRAFGLLIRGLGFRILRLVLRVGGQVAGFRIRKSSAFGWDLDVRVS